ncbi:MAG: hypothetical protein IT320_19320 [Anaerolineae bacterium]|nr:hypothetical protein [Anaerolineae bacterium]
MDNISVNWDDECATMLRLDIKGSWLWQEIYDAHEHMWQMVEARGVDTTLVYNLNHVAWHQYPIHSVVVPMHNVYRMHHPCVVQVVAITGSQSVFVRSMVQMLLRQLPELRTLCLAHDLDEARLIAAQVATSSP